MHYIYVNVTLFTLLLSDVFQPSGGHPPQGVLYIL